jgi:hypothetical protein
MTGIACVRAQNNCSKCLGNAQKLALKKQSLARHAALRERAQIYENAFDRANGAGISGRHSNADLSLWRRRIMHGTVLCPHQPSAADVSCC